MIPSSYIRVSEYNPHKNFYKITPDHPFDIFCNFFSNAFNAQYVKSHDDLTVILKSTVYHQYFFILKLKNSSTFKE